MAETIQQQVQELYARLRTIRVSPEFSTFQALAPSAHETDGAAAVKSLRLAYDRLDDVFQTLVGAGQIAKARRVKAVMDEIAAVSIGINRAVIAHLDGAADVANATERIKAASKDLEDEAKRVKENAENLGEVSTAVEVLTQIVEF